MLHKFLILSLLFSILYTKTPETFSALGDVLYNNASSLKKLSSHVYFSGEKEEIKNYLKQVKKVKKIGFLLDAKKCKTTKKEYLQKLRDLAKENDNYVRQVEAVYTAALIDNNVTLFADMVNSSLLDINSYREEVLDFYMVHKDEINATGVLQDLLEAQDAELKAKKEEQTRQEELKKKSELEKIKRIRAKDKQEHEALEKRLQEELETKKLEE